MIGKAKTEKKKPIGMEKAKVKKKIIRMEMEEGKIIRTEMEKMMRTEMEKMMKIVQIGEAKAKA